MDEIWKDIPGYEGIYQVSNNGKVKSMKRIRKGGGVLKEKMMTLYLDKDGYVKTSLYKNKKKNPMMVHRLVAFAFIDNPNMFPQINHKDENHSNNNVENLEWCDSKYNTNYGSRSKKISGEKHGLHKLTNEEIKYIRNVYIPYHNEFSGAALARKFGVTQSAIQAVVNNKTWKE